MSNLQTKIMPQAEPFFLPGQGANRKIGCLLIHGFTGAPTEMRWLGEDLQKRGYNVLGVRLAGHGTQPQDMVRSRWGDWVASVEDGWHLLKDQTDRIFVIGLSMGGVLGLQLAARCPVAGVVAMSIPYQFPNPVALRFKTILPLISKIMPMQTKAEGGWVDLEAAASHISYPQNPVRSAHELIKLIANMRQQLPQVQAPTLVIHSKNDLYVNPTNADQLYQDLQCSDKRQAWVERSGHVITRDCDREQVFQVIADFIQSLI